jgi:lipopolysaccharide/colanic/teichoic acid biosynthesis glycosyltransferase
MTKFQNKLYQAVLFVGDALFFILSLYVAQALRNQGFVVTFEQMSLLTLAFSPIFIVVIMAYFIAMLYEVPPLFTNIARVKSILQLHVVALIFGFSIFYFTPILGLTPKVILLLQMGFFTMFQIFWRVSIAHRIRTKKKTRALLVGESPEIAELKKTVNSNPHSSLVFIDHIEINSPLLTLETLESLKIVLEENTITVLVVDVRSEKVAPLLPFFYNLVGDGIQIYDVHKMYEDTFRRMPLSAVGYFWFFENVTIDMRIYEIVKRGVDIVISLLVAVVWLAIHPLVAYLIRREDGGEVFLSNQLRIGRHGKKIQLIKYRTMSNDDGGVWLKEKGNKNKVTKIGYFLRKSRIDELPQVINVLRGDISLIGPRPDIVDLGERMEREIPFYMIRYSVSPGLSGWAQTLQEKPPQSVEETKIRLMYDLFYIKNRSLLLDSIILLRTIRTLLMRSGM